MNQGFVLGFGGLQLENSHGAQTRKVNGGSMAERFPLAAVSLRALAVPTVLALRLLAWLPPHGLTKAMAPMHVLNER